MLNWLRGLFNRYGGALHNIWNDVVNLVMAVQGFDEAWLNQLLNIAFTLQADIRTVIGSFNGFLTGSYTTFVRWVQQQLFDINVRADEDYKHIGADIAALQARTNQQITVTQQTESSDIAGLIKWVLEHIFGPLSSQIAKALAWIENEGAYLIDLLTHADKLLAWLFAFLFKSWSTLLDKFGKLALAWFLGNWKLVAPLLVTILEDIITSVL